MKCKQKFPKWILLLAFVLNINTMKAQEKTESLDPRQQSIVAISSLTATGDLDALKVQLNTALDSGLTVNEIKEILVQLYAYSGFPRSLNALNTFTTVLDERKAKGIIDVEGKEIVVENKVEDKYEQGRKTLEILTKVPQVKPASGFGKFGPRVDAFLKEHLFADIFASDVLSYQQRELATISALSAMTGVAPQLNAHLGMGRNTGLTDGQFTQLADLIEQHINRTQANILRDLLKQPVVPVIEDGMMVRISEIEIQPEYLEEYKAILKEESAASVEVEPGVIAIFPMYQKEHPTQVRIIEIYANKAAYQSHLQTPHFQHYKTTTLDMVKSLKLVDMNGIDQETMLNIFSKLK
ncbi:carboxymuconolactone decarboxylase family protein [Sphingobacterium prati]|uniref:carboxymuconolactone decarboxylase family protein n=1 Tax=Sphingobacterium prati TaxID=2737006 RepID=UPI001C1312A1|nr:carboxymuconolactone decarboxylase family protein [Sphingobacterium prati]